MYNAVNDGPFKGKKFFYPALVRREEIKLFPMKGPLSDARVVQAASCRQAYPIRFPLPHTELLKIRARFKQGGQSRATCRSQFSSAISNFRSLRTRFESNELSERKYKSRIVWQVTMDAAQVLNIIIK